MTEVHSWRDAPPGDYAVIGDPIAHTKSPAMHHAAYRALGLDLTYRAIHVPVGEVPQALEHLRDLGYCGVNVTVPHKEAALAWVPTPDPSARQIGAANTLDLRIGRGANTDGLGFVRSLPPDAIHRDTLILGAGGTSAALIDALLEQHGRGRIRIWNRNPERAARLLHEMENSLKIASPSSALLPISFLRPIDLEDDLRRRRERLRAVQVVTELRIDGFGLIVNATPASLRGDDLGVDWSTADPDTVAYDLAYGVDDAPFLRGARAAGLRGRDGRDMLAGQGAWAFAIWGLLPSGVRPRFSETLSIETAERMNQEIESIARTMREALD